MKTVFVRRGAICQKELMYELVESFDPNITSKAVSDSLQYLMKIKYLEKFWDSEIKKYKYRIPKRKRN